MKLVSLYSPSRFAYSLVDDEDADDDDEGIEQGTNKNFGESLDNTESCVNSCTV